MWEYSTELRDQVSLELQKTDERWGLVASPDQWTPNLWYWDIIHRLMVVRRDSPFEYITSSVEPKGAKTSGKVMAFTPKTAVYVVFNAEGRDVAIETSIFSRSRFVELSIVHFNEQADQTLLQPEGWEIRIIRDDGVSYYLPTESGRSNYSPALSEFTPSLLADLEK